MTSPWVNIAGLGRGPHSELDAIRGDVDTMLNASDRPTAVIGLFDELALIVMQEATRLGITIPGQL